MKTKIKLLFTIAFLILFSSISAQDQHKIDSLLNILETTKEDTIKVNILLSLSKNLYSLSAQKAIEYGSEAKELANKIEYKEAEAYALKYIGLAKYFQGDYSQVIYYWEQALEIFEEIEDKIGIANILSNLGVINNNQGNYGNALELYFQALKLAEEIGDTNRMVTTLNNIGLIYSKKLASEEIAIENYFKALELSRKIKHNVGIGTATINIGEIYYNQKKYTKSLKYFEISVNAYSKTNSVNITDVLTYIGKIYVIQKDFKKAIDYQVQSFNIAKEMGAKLEMTNALLGMAETFYIIEEYKKALKYYNEALALSCKLEALYQKQSAYEGLSNVYNVLYDFKKAYEFHKRYKEVNDSIFNVEGNKQLLELESRYQTEKKQQQIELQETQLAQQEAEIEQQKIQQKALVGGLFAVLIIIVLIIIGYIRIRTANIKIILQKFKIEKKNEIIEEKNKNITDSINYAKRIQESVFLSSNEMKRHFQDSFLLNQPKDIVSGDFFWFAELNNKKIFAVVDCTGHGVPGAFMSLIGNSLLNEIVKEKNILEPSEILNALHLGVMGVLRQGTEQSKANDGMDMIICVYDEKKKELHFSGARNFMYLKNGKDLEILEGDPFSIEEIPYSKDLDVKFNTCTVKIEGETKIYLMTDGYMDQFGGPKLKKFNQGPFEEMLLENLHLPMLEQKEKMLQAFTDWKGSYKQIDDVMILGISLS